MSTTPDGATAALQDVLAGEHAAVYAYGMVGAHLPPGDQPRARAGRDAHRTARDDLAREVHAGGGEPVAAAPAYALPFPVSDPAAAARLAVHVEERLAASYADLVSRGGSVRARARGAAGMAAATLAALGWGGTLVAFPGLPERA